MISDVAIQHCLLYVTTHYKLGVSSPECWLADSRRISDVYHGYDKTFIFTALITSVISL